MASFAAALKQNRLALGQVVYRDYSHESGFKEAVLLRQALPDGLTS